MFQILFRSCELSESNEILFDIILFKSCKHSESMEFRLKASEAKIFLKASQVNSLIQDALIQDAYALHSDKTNQAPNQALNLLRFGKS